MSKRHDSAGLVIYRRKPRLEFLLVHPGGPYWVRKDDGAWSIPKGEIEAGEDLLRAARRETEEETGFVPGGKFRRLRPVRQPSGKVIHSWMVEGDFDPRDLKCTTFEMEWPPHSGQRATFPECDRAGWFDGDTSMTKITGGQRPIIEHARSRLEAEEAAT